METGKGVALKYNGDLPQIVAIARGKLLDRLLEIAEENSITVYRDPDLTEVLSQLEIGASIPEDLFKAVSEVLAYCYKINAGFRKKMAGLK
ncbi:MAG: flagellar biosynthesis protein FlhB [bacterium]|nr:flagellar biosynthesis protein FlhB [bacterium]